MENDLDKLRRILLKTRNLKLEFIDMQWYEPAVSIRNVEKRLLKDINKIEKAEDRLSELEKQLKIYGETEIKKNK